MIDPKRPWISPTLTPHRFDGPFEVAGIKVRPFAQEHGHMPSLGLRFDDAAAYSTDAHSLDEAAFETLAGVGVWIVDCIGRTAPWHPFPSRTDPGIGSNGSSPGSPY